MFRGIRVGRYNNTLNSIYLNRTYKMIKTAEVHKRLLQTTDQAYATQFITEVVSFAQKWIQTERPNPMYMLNNDTLTEERILLAYACSRSINLTTAKFDAATENKFDVVGNVTNLLLEIYKESKHD